MLLSDFVDLCQKRLAFLFDKYLVNAAIPSSLLKQAIQHSVFNGGKRLRPLLVYAVGNTFGIEYEELDAPACAIEFLHTYSLIHDDLPSMDNSDLRRGKPTCHKVFGEAMAILAGDALQSLSFQILTSHPAKQSAKQRLDMINCLAVASGTEGMVSGQAIDLAGVDSLVALENMYQLKTGKLLLASVKLGLIASGISDPERTNAFEHYINNISLAFQFQDDLFDMLGKASDTGKPQGLDQANQKFTYPSLVGVEKTQEVIRHLFENALQQIRSLEEDTMLLEEIACSLMERKY